MREKIVEIIGGLHVKLLKDAVINENFSSEGHPGASKNVSFSFNLMPLFFKHSAILQLLEVKN